MKKKKPSKGPLPHWAIYLKCAKKGGEIVGYAVTCTTGDCLYCKAKNVILIPVSDFNWAKLKRKAIWD